MSVRTRHGLLPLAVIVTLTACGSTSQRAGTPTGPSSTAPAVVSSGTSPARPTTTITVQLIPDADSIARILLAIPVPQRPVFLDPYGSAIHGSQLGLGPSLRIAGYRADPLFVCIQHVDMKAGTAGSWTAYAATAKGSTSSGGSGGQCPPAPGRIRVLE